MSRPLLGLDYVAHRFPRVSGDEPHDPLLGH